MLLFFLDVLHIEVRFTEELRGLELIRLFEVHTLHSSCLSRRKVSCRLTANPARSHIRNLSGRNQAIHLLVIRGRDTLIIDADALGGLFHLAEDIIL